MQLADANKRAVFVLAALAILSLYAIKGLYVTCVPPQAYESVLVEFEWFGMDATEIEKKIAIPLEEKIRTMQNLVSVQTTCEYSKCSSSALFYKEKKSARFSISAAALELWQSLPNEAQRPKVYESSSETKWIFCAAFDKNKFSREQIEKKLRSGAQKILGASQVSFAGGNTNEIQAAFDDKRLGLRKMFPWELAECLQEQNALATFGQGLSYSNELLKPSQINSVSFFRQFGEASQGIKKMDSIVRINGEECVTLNIKSSDASKNIYVCKEARALLKKEFKEKNDYKIIYDNGQEQQKELDRMLAAFMQSLLALGAASFIFFGSAKKTAAILLWTALDLLYSLAIMSALKIPLDSATISGITISLGLICDAALYMADDVESSRSAMIASSSTTIIAMLSLCVLEITAPGIKALGISSAVCLCASTFLAAFFAPLFFSDKAGIKRERGLSFKTKIPRKVLKLSDLLNTKPRTIVRLSRFLYIFPFFLFAFLPKNLKTPDNSSIIYAQVEYETERSFESIDKELLPFLEEIKKIKGVKFVQTEAKRGCAEIQIAATNERRKNEIGQKALGFQSLLTGSLYVPIIPPKKRVVQSMRFGVLGPDSALCKKLCKTLCGKRFPWSKHWSKASAAPLKVSVFPWNSSRRFPEC